MDYFKSSVTHLEAENGVLQGVDRLVSDSNVHDDGVHFQPSELCWYDGGLEQLLANLRADNSTNTEMLFFRGAAMFDNVDDAKNDYLMEAEIDIAAAEATDSPCCYQHVPFGVVIPQWREGVVLGSGQPNGIFTLIAATVIIMWQELI